jgi:exopolysaccharide biosynthesis polyprenyl glycosylphosphotransferase
MKASTAAGLGWIPVRVDDRPRQDEILSESAFQKIVVRERKRSERSGDPFILVCVDVSALRGDTGQVDPVLRDSIFSLLICTFRETDLVGWYERDRIAGALLTELGDVKKEAVRQVVTDKVERCLGCRLPQEVAANISISVYYFPDEVTGETVVEIREILYPDLMGQERSRRGATALKRAGDVLVSLALIVVLAPLLLLIATLIKLTSKGPVLFRQERLGQFGKSFEFLKFRSMYINTDSSVHEQYIQEFIKNGTATASDPQGKPVFKLVQDPRVTRIGRFLRKSSLDELPQFFNVLKGEMSLVGPRPPIPYELRQYDIWHRRRILEVRPGITGFWQVHGRSRTTFDEMVRMDLHYARNWSFWLDLKLLFQTPLVVLRGDGAV